MKNRKRTFFLVIVMFLSSLYLYESYWGKTGEWKINWGLQVPQPSKLTTVYEVGGFQDYEGYHIAEFSNWKLQIAKNVTTWNRMNDSNLDMVSKRAELFRTQTINSAIPDEKAKKDLIQRFKNNPVAIDKDSLWYLKEKREDDYFLAILNPNTKKLYVIERAF